MLFSLIFLIFFSSNLHSYENKLALKGGLGITYNTIEAKNNSEDKFTGYGVSSQYGYRWVNWELNLSGFIFFGKIQNLEFQANGTNIRGSGVVRTVSIGPQFKYLSSYEMTKGWYPYLSLGPSWGLKTIKLDNYTSTGGEFRKDHKLTYTSAGGIVSFGIEERLTYKEEHPVYCEFLFGYNKAKKVSIVDTSNFREVETLSKESAENDIYDYLFMINFGMTIF